MFPHFFGPSSETPAVQLVEEPKVVIDITTRRTEAEVYKLVRTFQGVLEDTPELGKRLEYFWPSTEFSDRVLFAIAHDIPKAMNPLWPLDPNEVFPEDEATAGRTSKQPLPSGGDDDDDNVSDESFDAILGGKKRLAGRHKRRKRKVATEPKCVEWLGFVNESNGFAAIKLTTPGTFEAWITWTNRLMVYLFGLIPNYEIPEDFVRILQPPEGGPFLMRCKNPRCVRLAHINYLGSSYIVDAVSDSKTQRGSQTQRFLAPTFVPRSKDYPTSATTLMTSYGSRALTTRTTAFHEADTSSGLSPVFLSDLSTSFSRPDHSPTGLGFDPSAKDSKDSKARKKKKERARSGSEEEEMAPAVASDKRVVWSPGFD